MKRLLTVSRRPNPWLHLLPSTTAASSACAFAVALSAWVRVVDHVQDAAEPATRHFPLTHLDTHIAGGAGFAWPAVLRRGCTPARQTKVNCGDLPRSHGPDQNLTLLLLTRYTSVFCGSCS